MLHQRLKKEMMRNNKLKVIAFNGSPKIKGNTYQALSIVGKKLAQKGIEMEIVQIGSKKFQGCIGCGACGKLKNETCPVYQDELSEIIQKAKEADGILLGSPVYYAGINGTMKSFLDRFFMVCGVNGNLVRHKVGASIAAVRRSGGIQAVDELNKYLQYSEMVMPTSNYWTVVHGNEPGEINEDIEGVQILEVLGENMAWIMSVLNQSSIEKPIKARKSWTNFVR